LLPDAEKPETYGPPEQDLEVRFKIKSLWRRAANFVPMLRQRCHHEGLALVKYCLIT
jgi:hypothetical protein